MHSGHPLLASALAKSPIEEFQIQLFKQLVSGIPCEAALRGKEAEQNWQTFKNTT